MRDVLSHQSKRHIRGKLYNRKIRINLESIKFKTEESKKIKLYDEIGRIYKLLNAKFITT